MSVWQDALAGVFLGGGGVVGAAVGAEVIGSSRWLSRRLIHRAIERVPERRRNIRREEWVAEWEAFDGANMARVLWSVGVYIGAVRLAARERGTASVRARAKRTERSKPFRFLAVKDAQGVFTIEVKGSLGVKPGESIDWRSWQKIMEDETGCRVHVGYIASQWSGGREGPNIVVRGV